MSPFSLSPFLTDQPGFSRSCSCFFTWLTSRVCSAELPPTPSPSWPVSERERNQFGSAGAGHSAQTAPAAAGPHGRRRFTGPNRKPTGETQGGGLARRGGVPPWGRTSRGVLQGPSQTDCSARLNQRRTHPASGSARPRLHKTLHQKKKPPGWHPEWLGSGESGIRTRGRGKTSTPI